MSDPSAAPRESLPVLDPILTPPPPEDLTKREDLTERIVALIRNGLSNGPIAWSQPTWDHLQTRLGQIARAVLEEL